MATSGSVNFNQQTNSIINRSLRILGVLGEGQSASAEELFSARTALNALLKNLQVEGAHIWKYKEAALWLVQGQYSYSMGSTTTDHVSSVFAETTLLSDASSGASTIDVTSIIGISDGDNIGITLDDNSIQWTTVNGIPSGSTVTLTATLTGDSVLGNRVFAYTNKAERPLRIFNVRRENKSIIQTPLNESSYNGYFNLPNKAQQGHASTWSYNPKIDNGTFYLYQAPSDGLTVIKFNYEANIEDMDDATNDPDFPQEWLRPLAYLLASDLGDEYEKSPQKMGRIEQKANELLQKALDWDRETTSIFFSPSDGQNSESGYN